MRSKVDIAVPQGGRLHLHGWAFARDPEEKVRFKVTDEKGKKVPGMRFSTVRRDSVVETYFPDYAEKHGHSLQRELGYEISVPYQKGRGEVRVLWIRADGRTRKIRFDDKKIEYFNSKLHRKREKILALVSWETLEVSFEFFRENGPFALWKKAVHKLQGFEDDYEYDEWYKKTRISNKILQAQRKESFSRMPKFAIVIPVYKTPERFLQRMLDSIRQQTYGLFEVYCADATPYSPENGDLEWGAEDGKLPKEVLARFHAQDGRFHYVLLGENLGISDNTNAAIRQVGEDCDFVVLCDHDDELLPEALYECAKTINAHPDAKVLYSDEDKIDFASETLFEPHFKTDYNPDLLRSVNYICHLFVIARDLLEEISEEDAQGGKVYERKEYDGAQDYDLILRACERAGQMDRESILSAEDMLMLREARYTSSHILHIPKVLYHWRSHQMSTASNPETKLYAFEAGSRAIRDHCKRIGLPIERVEQGITYGFYHPVYKLLPDPRTGEEPLVSVIIPNKDHHADLDKAIRSLLEGEYQNLEFIIVENNSILEETFHYYEKIQREFPFVAGSAGNGGSSSLGGKSSSASSSGLSELHGIGSGASGRDADAASPEAGKMAMNGMRRKSPRGDGSKWPQVRVVYWDKEFNYSAINNFAVQYARGDYLLFMNNDIELIAPDSLREMMMYVQREDVGICGARLLYPDEVIQHAGVVMGFGGIAGAAFVGIHNKENTYMHRAKCIQDYSAVTAACMLCKKSVFEEVNGFNEDLAVAFNDVDFCLRVRTLGKRIVYNPYALFYHYESKSRGLEDTPEKVERFNSEIVKLARRWPQILRKGDPYYHPGLTLRKSNFVLRDLRRGERPGEPFPMEILDGIV